MWSEDKEETKGYWYALHVPRAKWYDKYQDWRSEKLVITGTQRRELGGPGDLVARLNLLPSSYLTALSPTDQAESIWQAESKRDTHTDQFSRTE